MTNSVFFNVFEMVENMVTEDEKLEQGFSPFHNVFHLLVDKFLKKNLKHCLQTHLAWEFLVFFVISYLTIYHAIHCF